MVCTPTRICGVSNICIISINLLCDILILPTMQVAVLGATGATGTSIIKALQQAGNFSISALVRPSSIERPATRDLEAQGVRIIPFDLTDPVEESARKIQDYDVVLAAISIAATAQQIPLATVAKAAGVRRFVPCFYAPVAPPKGVVALRDIKEDVLNHVKKLHLPYTVVDIGWWYQITLPRLPSGRIDSSVSGIATAIPGDGNVPSAFSSNEDFGKYIPHIIADPRTLNKSIFTFSDILTLNEIYDYLEQKSGEKVPRQYMPGNDIVDRLATFKGDTPAESGEFFQMTVLQYWYSWAVRGDNTVEYARYLGYLIGKELYPDVKTTSFREYIQKVIGSQ
ncbi:hypothetical protein V2G26_016576 [Clonostachys chloroleuca]